MCGKLKLGGKVGRNTDTQTWVHFTSKQEEERPFEVAKFKPKNATF